jgi:hypothetical protein
MVNMYCFYNHKNKEISLSMVVHICNPSYSEGREKERGWRFKASLGNKQDLITTNKLGMVVHICNPSYIGDISRMIGSKLAQGKKCETLSKK